MTRYRRIAYISRARGLNGELVVAPLGNLPFHMQEGLRLWVVPPDHGLIRETTVRTARQNADTLAARQSADTLATRQNADMRVARQNADTLAARQNADMRAARQSADMRAARQSADTLYLTLEGVADVATAQRLAGRYLLARDCDLEYETAEEGHSYLGLSVFDRSAGFIGTVVEERIGPAQLLLVVEGPFGEVLIPAVDEFIESIDEGALFVALPQGLLELNR